MSKLKRVLALFLTVALVTAAVPGMYMEEAWADVDTRIADASTMDSWKTYFGESDTAFTTRYAGHVWTDKSVLTGAGALSYAKEKANGTSTISLTPGDTNNFLVSLSAMAASEAISGQANKPTDTMIILDLSSSMYNGSSRTPDSVKIMVDAVNDTIDKLQKLNQNNKVGVTIYFGGGTILNSTSTKSCGMVLLPLDRYVRNGSSSDKQFLKINTSGGKLQSVQVNSGVKNSAGSTVAQTKHTVADIAGTYAQLGILHAMDEFLKADPVIPASASYQAGVTKTPVFIFMSDGEPTAATHQYWDKTKTSGMGNNRVVDRNPNQTDFVTQLTAAYAKMKVDARYA